MPITEPIFNRRPFSMNRICLMVICTVALLAVLGCEARPQGGPLGPVRDSPLLTTFAGEWKFDFERTLQARIAAGRPAEEIALLRELQAKLPQLGMHSDLTITGDTAVGEEPLVCEYRFFAMHPHDETVCGKAWHHEDRSDPGDMSKCYVRLQNREGFLYLSVKTNENGPQAGDPDLAGPVESGSASECDAENPPDEGWSSDWEIYVFSQKQ